MNVKEINVFKLKVFVLHIMAAASVAIAGFYLTPFVFDVYYNVVKFRLRQTDLSLTPRKEFILPYLALLATLSVASAIVYWLTANAKKIRKAFICQIVMTVLIFILCIASIILILLKKLTIMSTAILIMIIVTLVSLLWLISLCGIFSKECCEFSEALKPGLPINDSQKNLDDSEKRLNCMEKVIQWFENFFVGDLDTKSWDSWDFIILGTNFVYTVYQLYLLLETLEDFFSIDESPYGDFKIAGLSRFQIAVCFLFFYCLESLCYTCSKTAEYIGSSRPHNTTSFFSRGFWCFFDWLTQSKYKNLSSPVTVMPRPLWIKTIVLALGLVSPIVAQMIDHAFMLVTMKLRCDRREDRNPTESEGTEYARNDTEFNRLQNNLVFVGIILGVLDLAAIFGAERTQENYIEKQASLVFGKSGLRNPDAEMWMNDLKDSMNNEKIKELSLFIVLLIIAIFNSPLTANGYGLAMRGWLGLKDNPSLKIFFWKFLEHFSVHNCKMFTVFFVLYALLPTEYQTEENVFRSYIHKPEALIVILVYFTGVHLITGILLDRTWADFWEQFKELKRSDQVSEPITEKTEQIHGFKTSDRLKNFCYPLSFTLYAPIALINALYRAIFFEPFYNSPATVIFYHSSMLSVVAVAISIGVIFVPISIQPNSTTILCLFLSGSIIGFLVAIVLLFISPIIYNDVNFSPNEQRRKADEHWDLVNNPFPG